MTPLSISPATPSDVPDRRARWTGLLKGECGSGLVEYAIVFTIFMTMLLGIADFGRAMYAYHFVSSAARDATRWAAVNGANCAQDASCTFANGAQPQDVENFVTQHEPLGINSAQLVVHPTWPFLVNSSPTVCSTTQNAPGCTVRVQVNYTFSFAVPIVGQLINGGNPITLSSTSQMLVIH
jgi:Flp pilus assembly protein TadG